MGYFNCIRWIVRWKEGKVNCLELKKERELIGNSQISDPERRYIIAMIVEIESEIRHITFFVTSVGKNEGKTFNSKANI